MRHCTQIGNWDWTWCRRTHRSRRRMQRRNRGRRWCWRAGRTTSPEHAFASHGFTWQSLFTISSCWCLWHDFSQYERLSWIRCDVLPRTAIWDGGCFGAPRADGYKWQYILIAAFSSYSSYYNFKTSHMFNQLRTFLSKCLITYRISVRLSDYPALTFSHSWKKINFTQKVRKTSMYNISHCYAKRNEYMTLSQ